MRSLLCATASAGHRGATGGRCFVFGPRGLPHRAVGLRVVRLGACAAATGSGTPIVPEELAASRDVVRPAGFPRRGGCQCHHR